jgi:putative endonuclease
MPMEKSFVYILFSKQLNRYYIGSTRLLAGQRLERHLAGYYGKTKFTAKANDWELFYSIACMGYSQAHKIERHIKRMKSKKYIENLATYPEITEKLLLKYADC